MARSFMQARPLSSFKLKLASSAALAASFGALAIELLPHSLFIDKFKSIIQMYKLGKPISLREDIQDLFDEVLVDLKIKENEKKYYDSFPMPGFDTYHAGLVPTEYGFVSHKKLKAIIGIPFNYTYKDKYSINTTEIRIGAEKEILNVYHPSADDFLESIVLSKKAQKFGIAREILMAKNNLPIFKGLQSFIMFNAFNCMLFLTITSKASKPIKMTTCGSIVLVGFSLWFQIRDSLHKYYEVEVDKELAKLGPEYVEGGKEFYAKLLKRNVAIRMLLGKIGSHMYNRDGDEKIFIRQKRTPITLRQKFFNEFSLPEASTKSV